jgi:ATP-dependent RNA circularization protein (DNA/RNA ligase family)
VRCGSRNRGLEEGSNDNHGFRAHIESNIDLQLLVLAFPDYVFYGEWLVPHTYKNYREDAWHKFYIFDVWSRALNSFIHYDIWKPKVVNDYPHIIPCYKVVDNGNIEDFIYVSKTCDFLLKDLTKGPGEGVVIKNYEYQNVFKTQTWAKIVTSEFKEENMKIWGPSHIQRECIEEIICNKYVTKALVDKEFAKFQDLERKRQIPALLESVFRCVISEELYNALNKLNIKQPIDFRMLKTFAIKKIKALLPELF